MSEPANEITNRLMDFAGRLERGEPIEATECRRVECKVCGGTGKLRAYGMFRKYVGRCFPCEGRGWTVVRRVVMT